MKIYLVEKDKYNFIDANVGVVHIGRVNIGTNEVPVWRNGIIIDYNGTPTAHQIRSLQNHYHRYERIRIDPSDNLTPAELREMNSEAEAKLAVELKSLTPPQAAAYIEANVTTLASAKTVLKIMARMLIAMRDKVWPDLPDS